MSEEENISLADCVTTFFKQDGNMICVQSPNKMIRINDNPYQKDL